MAWTQVAYKKSLFLYFAYMPLALASLGPWKFVLDMGSSSHWGLIRAPDHGRFLKPGTGGTEKPEQWFISIILKHFW